MRPLVIVVGAGAIGRRHLQALLNANRPLRLMAVDPSPSARRETQVFLEELGRGQATVGFASIDGLPTVADVAIVATTANVRRAAIEQLLDRVRVPFLVLEKFLFQRTVDFDSVSGTMERSGVRAWANCPRRAWHAYRELRARIGPPAPVHLEVRVPIETGVGSNAIHFLDLLAFLSGCTEFEVDASGLDPIVRAAKRPGVVEFTGELVGRGPDGSVLSYRTEPIDQVLAKISWLDNTLLIDETNGRVSTESGVGASRVTDDGQFQVVLQSELTNRVVTSLLETGDCHLTSYAESMALHVAILRPLLEHYRAVVDPSAEECPIT